MRVCDFVKDERFEGFLLVRTADQRTGSNGSKYLDLNLADISGEINAKVWDNNALPPKPGAVIKVRGLLLEYNGRLQLRVEKIREVAQGDNVNMAELAPCAPETPEAMLTYIHSVLSTFEDTELRQIVETMLVRFADPIMYFPAAQRIHHAERSGLLHHTTGMLRTAEAVAPLYPFLNRDLLFAGVIVHDLCKVEEMRSDKMGVVSDYSKEGLLLGHLVLGVTRIQEAANELGITGEKVLLLQHLMISHHGEAEFGSPKKPMIPEAEVLHWIDLLDARMNEMHSALAKLKPGVFSERIWSLDRRLYRVEE